MAHAIHINFGKHDRYGRPSNHNGWWKFGVFAVTATAIGVLAVHTIWNTGSSPIPEQEPGIRIEVAPVANVATVPGTGAQTIPVAPSIANAPTAPVITAAPAVTNAPAVPAPSTSAELDTPSSTENVQKSAQSTAGTTPATSATVLPPPVASNSTANSSTTAPANPAPAVSIAPSAAATSVRSLDLSTMPALQALATQVNGRIDSGSTQYADVTGDGADEAIVPITSGGTQGDLGFAVIAQTPAGPQTILTRLADRTHQGLVIGIDNGKLTETSAAYGPNDANCCPSQITRTYFSYNGSSLVVDHADTINVPQGKDAD